MKPSLPMVLLLLAASAFAQDVEPTLDRAVASLVREMVVELPYRIERADALAIDPEPSADRHVVLALAGRLLKEGFRIEAAPSASAGSVSVRVATRESGGIGTVRVAAGDFAAERRFGRAGWVDQPRDSGAIVVLGAPRDSAADSIASAREKLAVELRARFPSLARTAEFERYASRQPTSTFVAERSVAGRKQYEAYLMAEPSFDRLARAERIIVEAERRTPWVKAAAVAAAGGFLWFLYLRADFRTRGFKTRRLRFLFGTLFAALSLGLWSLSL